MKIKLVKPFQYDLPEHGQITVYDGITIDTSRRIHDKLPDISQADDFKITTAVLSELTFPPVSVAALRALPLNVLADLAREYLQRNKKEVELGESIAAFASYMKERKENLNTTMANLGSTKATDALFAETNSAFLDAKRRIDESAVSRAQKLIGVSPDFKVKQLIEEGRLSAGPRYPTPFLPEPFLPQKTDIHSETNKHLRDMKEQSLIRASEQDRHNTLMLNLTITSLIVGSLIAILK